MSAKIEIYKNTLLKLLVRRGTNVDRQNVILTEGELGYTIDTKRLFVGDGQTQGGISIGSTYAGSSTDVTDFVGANVGDYAFDTDNNKLYVHHLSGSASNIINWREVGGVYTASDSTIVVNGNNGQQSISVQTSSGTYVFTQSGTYYNPNEISNTQYYGSTGANVQQYNGAYGGSATAVTGPYGNTAYYAQGPYGNAVAGTNANNNQNFYGTLPQGIPASQIPSGQEDLYILKSQVVPPVCPACPVSTATCPREEPCPPCEPCGRCPEPAFECKKVPNYNAIDNNYLPTPVLANFSTFGM